MEIGQKAFIADFRSAKIPHTFATTLLRSTE